ncbi:hypothetical protein SAMN05216227_105215 [Pseudorhodobacter antarcticus]|jgi:hypothetical protein|uniref:Uncharacterized protein n=1 Tax=Pseudorhodobacter antarcticus TaxID=1077947 RepID=A0A1H8MB14_9RHOB|nr:hypothetical protein [Pseudorhodobacter antarcticus]SEO14602.1 hypothetical protein SAMN05216227_105215 [Pseudorhodobacter antarcticus]
MARSAVRIATVVYDAARRSFHGAVEFFTPGLPMPLRIGVTLPGPHNIDHAMLVRGLVRAAERQILR